MQFLETQDPKVSHQIELERLHHKNQIMRRIRQEFTDCPEFDFMAHLEEHEIDGKFGLDLLTQMALRKRVTLPVLVGILRDHFADGEGNASQRTADEIMRCVAANLVTWSPDLRQLIVKIEIDDHVQEEIDRFQYPLPLIIPPREVRSNNETGYHHIRFGGVVTNAGVREDDICLDHINRVNAIPFQLNMDTATMVKNQWRNLDRKKPNETCDEYEKRRKQFERYDSVSREVMNSMMFFDNVLYLTHKYCFRGRYYCQGYHVNYQGTDWNKAVIELHSSLHEVIE